MASVTPAADQPVTPILSLAAITVFGLIGPFIFLVSPVIAGQLALEWHWSAGDIGQLMSVELGGAALVSFPAVFLLRRLPWRPLAAAASVVFAVAAVGSAMVARAGGDPAALVPLRFIGGAAGGMLSVVCLLAAGRSADPHRAFACWTGGQTVSAALGLLYLPRLFGHAGLAGLYALLGAAAFLALAVVAGLPAGWPRQPDAARGGRSVAARLNLFAIFCYYLAIGGAWAFVGVPGLGLGLSEEEVGTLTAVAMFTAILGSILATLAGRSRHRGVLSLGFFGLLLACLLALAFPPGRGVFVAAVVLLQVCWSFLVPMLLAALADTDAGGGLVILSNMIIGGGAALGPLLAGYALDYTGTYVAVAALGALLLVLSAAAFGWARRCA
ncbi:MULTISPECIES: MFS transporter [Nitrospirillum]|uniref:MFS transporter n=2 Tax=Nitrospirillum TaxID=1543705 RepID=A0A248JUW8_9PROT|nr:MFS transporter [Nitrospirillum amazonense]ASG22271.1 MFS transporter [Nitrospirillum amazonense CBAmc]MEC4594928.1 MFS transporter [Nitrospirillum amazonense]TWB25606.1 putative MFS family arabinose efflux permease [Nitrospirillum amazonense]TWB30961.1 putative MFS family arabinose efflux permease [Nitrospirillum amazonense]